MFANSDIGRSMLTTGLALATFTLPSLGCGKVTPPQASLTPEAAREQRLASVADYGEGVYVFSAQDFPQTLADFRKEHKNLRVVSISQGQDTQREYRANQRVAQADTFVVLTEKTQSRQPAK